MLHQKKSSLHGTSLLHRPNHDSLCLANIVTRSISLCPMLISNMLLHRYPASLQKRFNEFVYWSYYLALCKISLLNHWDDSIQANQPMLLQMIVKSKCISNLLRWKMLNYYWLISAQAPQKSIFFHHLIGAIVNIGL